MHRISLTILTVMVSLLVALSAANAYYDPDTARFITQDHYLGEKSTPPSLHRYTYAYNNPTAYFDPTGEATQSQYEDIITTSVTAYLKTGNRTAAGTAGEAILENALEKSGKLIIKGPVNNKGQHKADIVAYDPETKKILFIDNKIQGGKVTVSRANAISTTDGRAESIQDAMTKLIDADLTPVQKKEIKKALREVNKNPAKADWLVGNATHEEITNQVKRISTRLAEKGVRMLDVVGDKTTIKSLEKSIEGVRGSKKFLERMGKAIPLAGAGVSVAMGTIDVQRAMAEDYEYQEAMKRLGVKPAFPHQSTQRQLAIIAAEEAAGETVGAGGAFVGAFGGPWTSVGAAIAGGFAGDYAGGKYAAWQFDKSVELTDEQRKGIWEKANRKYSNVRNGRPQLTVEDRTGFQKYKTIDLE